ncbi:MAG: GAF domain-containing protein [Thermaerobacterales bacterium]
MQHLRRMAFWIPLLFLAALEIFRRLVLEPHLDAGAAFLTLLAVVAGGILVFGHWVFGLVDTARRREQQALRAAQQRYEQLDALREASLAMTADLQLETVLERVVDLSRRVVGARYGALGVLDPGGKRIARFITSGMDQKTVERLGHPPQGHGILGTVINNREALRLDDLTTHPDSAGFPANHPPMHSFLGIPVVYQDQVLGNLYLTEKQDGSFTEQDETLVRQFAAQAAVAITNAQLYQQVESLTLLEERERISMDLHDGTIQSLYALGLVLENSIDLVKQDPETVRRDLEQSIDALSRIIGDIRHYIFDMRLPDSPAEPFRHQVAALIEAMGVGHGLRICWDWDDKIEDWLRGRRLRTALLHILRETISNAVKQAKAGMLTVEGKLKADALCLAISDNGVGFDPEIIAAGRGLNNMEARAAGIDGRLHIHSIPRQGTRVELILKKKIEEAPAP